MMEFERTEVAVIAAFATSTAQFGNQLELPLAASDLLRAVALVVVVRVAVFTETATELLLATFQWQRTNDASFHR